MSYNGHANYETWVMSMYLDGNYTGEGTCRHYESMVASAVEDVREEIEEGITAEEATDNAIYSLAENLKANVEAEILCDDSLTSGIVGDLLGAALSEVDWNEIAKSRIEDAI
jgi:ADP-ribosylglycohydrolase